MFTLYKKTGTDHSAPTARTLKTRKYGTCTICYKNIDVLAGVTKQLSNSQRICRFSLKMAAYLTETQNIITTYRVHLVSENF